MSGTSGEKPAFLLAGGRASGLADMTRMISRAYGGVQRPLVAYIGAANGDSALFFKMMKTFLMRAGAGKVVFARLAKEKINLAEAKDILSSADVVFLSGGEVEDGMNWLAKHQLTGFLRELYREGKQFAGVSAGSIMLGNRWVRWEDPKDDGTAELFDCLCVVPAIFDTHAEDEDWVELKTALKLMGDGARGYGIPIGGMICAGSDGAIANLEKEYLTFVNDGGQVRQLTLDD